MKTRQGIAFVSVLLFSGVVLMAAILVAQRARTGAHFQMEDERDLAAFYAAEAGIELALARWSRDASKSWGSSPADNLIDHPLRGGQGTFSIRFSPLESVNNFHQASAADGPSGPASVPPHFAYVRVEGRAQGRVRVLEATVARSGLIDDPAALLGADRILLSGDVALSGLRSRHDHGGVSADLVCLNRQDDPNLISWTGPGQVNIDGVISSNSPQVLSISPSLSSANVTGGNLTAQNRPHAERLDITTRVNEKASQGLPAPSLTGTRTQLEPGDYYLADGLAYNGDLVLDGSNLYVEGEFDLNGSISGSGAIFVNGNCQFFGDSSLLTSDSAGVALYAEGDVNLKGFDGTRYLRELVEGAGQGPDGIAYTTHLDNFLYWTSQLNQLFGPVPAEGTDTFGYGGSLFDEHILALTRTSDLSYINLNLSHVSDSTGSPLQSNPDLSGAQWKLTQLLAAQPDTPSTRFLEAKFRQLNGGDHGQTGGADIGEYLGAFGRPGDGPATWTGVETLHQALTGQTAHGLFRALGVQWPQLRDGTHSDPILIQRRDELWHLARNQLRQMSLDRPGVAYFQGLIYSLGNITAENDLQIVGAVMAAGPHSQIRLQNGVRIAFVPELARSAGSSLGRVSVRTWIRR